MRARKTKPKSKERDATAATRPSSVPRHSAHGGTPSTKLNPNNCCPFPPPRAANSPSGPHDLRVGGRGRHRVLRGRLQREVRVGVDRQGPPPLEVHVVPELLDVAVRVPLLSRVLLRHLERLRGDFVSSTRLVGAGGSRYHGTSMMRDRFEVLVRRGRKATRWQATKAGLRRFRHGGVGCGMYGKHKDYPL